MRPGLVRLIFGIILLAGGVAATMLVEGFYWWGAIIVGAWYIIQGGVMIARHSRTGWEHLSKKE
ncbi:MAG: hypothetical protein ACRELY_13755 [Polyangiaceae bacterium]